eukprot:IDg2020t1
MAARKEMSQIMAKQRVDRAIRHNIPAAADRAFSPGDEVLVRREKIHANRIGEWLGPFLVDGVDAERKLVYVRDVAVGPAKPFNVAQVKRYYTPDKAAGTCFSVTSSLHWMNLNPPEKPRFT